MTLVFLHGMNSYGDDLFHFGPLTFRPMNEAWENEARKRGLTFVGITELHAASPEVQVEAALKCLEAKGVLQNKNEPLHLVGQSIGGITARLLARHPKLEGRVKSIVTIGTPHNGAPAAELGVRFRQRHPFISRILGWVNYDPAKREHIFEYYTRDAMKVFNEKYPERAEVPETAMVCELSPREISYLLWPLYFSIHKADGRGVRPASDGFVTSESQKRGRVLGPFAVDHISQLGFYFFLTPRRRKAAEKEFRRLVSATYELFS